MKCLLYTFLLLVLPLSSFADGFIPVITNYSSLDYEGGLQNWAIEQGQNGEIYIGNNMGVLCFDGYNWNLTRMPGNAIVRSLLVDGNRLYVGGYKNFGYFTRDSFGNLRFTSLWKRVKHYRSHHDEVWNIIKTSDGKIIFQTFASWFEYDGYKVKVHYDPTHLPLYFFKVFGKIYAQLINGPFCLLEGGHYRPVLSRKCFHDDGVVAALPLKEKQMILCTEFHGMFRYDGHRLVPFKSEIDNILKTAQVNRAIIVAHDSSIVIGTILGGIFCLDKQGRLKWHYDTHNLLKNNSVLRLFCDRENNIWAALDVGVALIHSGSPYSLFTDVTSSLGMVYDVYNLPNCMYIATNQCTYVFSGGKLTPIHGTEGQNWHLANLGNQLIVGNNHGPKYIYGMQAIRVPGSNDASSTSIRRYTTIDRDYLIESSYSVLRVYEEQNNRWRFRNAISGFSAPVRQFEIDGQSVIWAANMDNGLYRIELSRDLRRVSSVKYYPSLNGWQRSSMVHVMKIQGEIVFSDGYRLYTVEKEKIVPFKDLNSLSLGNIVSSTPVDNNRFWLVSDKGYTLVYYSNGKYHRLVYVPAAFFGLECSDYMNKVRIIGNMAYFCLNGGIGCMNMHAPIAKKTPWGKLIIRKIEEITSDRKQRLLPIDASNPSVEGTINILLSYPNYNNDQLRFVFTLFNGGKKESKTVSSKPEIIYSGMHYGNYHFLAEVIDVNGHKIGRVKYAFHCSRPLFLSFPAFAFYLILLSSIIAWYIRWKTNRIVNRRNREMEEIKMRQDLKMAEQQRIIESQKQLLLEKQLQDKGKEIASLTLDAVMHKRQVADIREVLENHSHKEFSSKQQIRQMLNHITNHIDTDEYWDIYRENFDLIHKNFFRILRKRYPSLTTTDLKFCALLRLNLSTKDIAHFTGLTVRGVEGARYRLRKKFKIGDKQNLTQFLIDLE